jgi:hypothetical protein
MPKQDTGPVSGRPGQAKGRQQRIPLDYYKKIDDIRRIRRILTWVALIGAVVWIGSGLRLRAGKVAETGHSRLRYSPGELASVHQAWNDRCEACHRDFTPINDSAWKPPLPIFATGPGSDKACQTCHQGPPHHPNQKAEDVKSCAGCHFDHRGKENSLVKLADSECVNCHGALSSHFASKDSKSKLAVAETITSFATDHPVFSTEKPGAKDPGKLKFNHALHMAPGLSRKADGRDVKTWAYITDADALKRFKPTNAKDGDQVQLDCKSCHVTDAADFGWTKLEGLPTSATLPARTDGKEMLPITYENQCKACHSLSFDGRDPSLVVPHRAQPDKIREFLWATYAGMFVKQEGKPTASPAPERPIPGQRVEATDATLRNQIEKSVTAAEKLIFNGKTTCLECHYATGTDKATGHPTQIERPNVPAFWLEKSRFDHTAHRAVNCKDCHIKAVTSDKSADILIPGLKSCQECHSPSTTTSFFADSTEIKGGVRHDCTACHRYHHADQPKVGRGSLSEKGTEPKDILNFLKGGKSGE